MNDAGAKPVVLSIQNGTLASLVYSKNRDADATLAVDRETGSMIQGPDYTDSPLNHIEVTAMAQAGEIMSSAMVAALEQTRATVSIQAPVVQRASCAYGKDYQLGDWLTVLVPGPNSPQYVSQIVTGVSWVVENRGGQPTESMGISLSSGLPMGLNARDVLRNICRRLKRVEINS